MHKVVWVSKYDHEDCLINQNYHQTVLCSCSAGHLNRKASRREMAKGAEGEGRVPL